MLKIMERKLKTKVKQFSKLDCTIVLLSLFLFQVLDFIIVTTIFFLKKMF